MGAGGLTGLMESVRFEKLQVLRQVVSDFSGGVGLVCELKGGIPMNPLRFRLSAILTIELQLI